MLLSRFYRGSREAEPQLAEEDRARAGPVRAVGSWIKDVPQNIAKGFHDRGA
jgi:hypothetical protein